jgi:hypothetical protein
MAYRRLRLDPKDDQESGGAHGAEIEEANFKFNQY